MTLDPICGCNNWESVATYKKYKVWRGRLTARICFRLASIKQRDCLRSGRETTSSHGTRSLDLRSTATTSTVLRPSHHISSSPAPKKNSFGSLTNRKQPKHSSPPSPATQLSLPRTSPSPKQPTSPSSASQTKPSQPSTNQPKMQPPKKPLTTPQPGLASQQPPLQQIPHQPLLPSPNLQ